MRKVTVKLQSLSPLVFNRPFISEKGENESHADYEKRCYMERVHTTENGNLCIPAWAVTKALQSAARHIKKPIDGVECVEDIDLGVGPEDAWVMTPHTCGCVGCGTIVGSTIKQEGP